MADQPTENELISFTDRQKQILRGLLLIGEGTPVYFKDACQLQNIDPQLETTTHLVGHLIREIESSIRWVLRGVADWSASASSPEDKDRAARIDAILKEFPELEQKPESHKDEIRHILEWLEVEEDDLVSTLWLSTAPKNCHSWAHRDDLHFPRPVTAEFLEYLDRMETVFELLIPKFEAKFSAVHEILEPKLLKPYPSKADAKWLKTKIPNNKPGRGYFFEKLANPEWLWPLEAEGLFLKPPEPQLDSVTGSNIMAPWAASGYLVRMSKSDEYRVQLKVQGILLSLKCSNIFVHLDILEAACSLPLELVQPLVEKEIQWLAENPFSHPLLPDKIADLVNHLTQLGDVKLALKLNRLALSLISGSPIQTEGD